MIVRGTTIGYLKKEIEHVIKGQQVRVVLHPYLDELTKRDLRSLGLPCTSVNEKSINNKKAVIMRIHAVNAFAKHIKIFKNCIGKNIFYRFIVKYGIIA